MTQIIIDDPDLYEKFEVKDDGRIYLGKDWAGKKVKIVIEEIDEPEGNQTGMMPMSSGWNS